VGDQLANVTAYVKIPQTKKISLKPNWKRTDEAKYFL
jgi:hypothetical protein